MINQLTNYLSRSILVALFLSIGLAGNSQQDYTFWSQADVDGFDPSITEVGNLKIGLSSPTVSIVDLSNLTGIQTITGNLTIYENVGTSNLEGLNGVTSIGGDLVIEKHLYLKNLSGLDNVTEIGGRLYLHDNILESLDGLNSLTQIGGELNLLLNKDLQNLDGLINLNKIDGNLSIVNNYLLQNLDGLSDLTEINGELRIEGINLIEDIDGLSELKDLGVEGIKISANDALKNIDALSNISQIKNTILISDNISLENINGLSGVTQINGTLWISLNGSLQNLDGLSSLDQLDGQLKIKGNNSLTNCCGLAPYIFKNNGLIPDSPFENNPMACTSQMEILETCGYDLVKLFCFYDQNANGIRDTNDGILSNVPILIDHLNYTSNLEVTSFYLLEGNKVCTVDSLFLETWNITSDSLTYSFLFDENFMDTLSFGLSPKELDRDISSASHSESLRCNTESSLFVNAQNHGTTIFTQGTLWLELDTLIKDFVFVDQADIISSPYRVGWYFTDLYPSESIQKEVVLNIPGVQDLALGTEISYKTYITATDQLGTFTTYPFFYTDVTSCAYDPNDKLVQPLREGNYSLFDEYLNFTIRFQNTGNAEAYDVTVYDQLDDNLDVSSFRLMGSSHPEFLTTSLVGNGTTLRFYFEDINLPDSLADYEGSQGYINFEIKTKEGLDEGITIENDANIYFDQNPAIVTNTTTNVMVTTLDYDEDGTFFWEDCDDYNEYAFPGNQEVIYNGIDDDCDPSTFDDDLDQDGYLNGEDCNDQDASINPLALEIPNNGIDEDCDGMDLTTETDNIALSEIRLYPNPAKQNFHIESKESSFSYKIYNGLGQIITSSVTFGTSAQGESQIINVSKWSHGVYYVQLQLPEGETDVRKVMVVE